MANSSPTPFSEDEQRLLHHEAFVSEVLHLRGDQERERESKPKWLRFLESSGGAALVTVALGGLVGQWITYSVQQRIKDKEFQQAWLQARGNQALVAYKEYLDQQQGIVRRAYELIGSCISTSEDLIVLTQPEFDLSKYSGDEQKEVAAQRATLRGRFNETDARWRSERESLGLLMSFYHPGKTDVATAWRAAQDEATAYMDCARSWYVSHQAGQPSENHAPPCNDEKKRVHEALAKVTTSVEGARKYAWEGWESPDELKKALEQ